MIIAALALIILNYFFGDALILRADGLVVSQRYAVSSTYAAKVAAVYVKQGDRVTEGQVLAKLESAEVLKDIPAPADSTTSHLDRLRHSEPEGPPSRGWSALKSRFRGRP